jgi:hypothetical protein
MKCVMTIFLFAPFFFSAASIAQAQDRQALFFENTGVVMDAGAACNGGTCQTRNGTVLACPSTGGPICPDDKACICQCFKVGNTYTAANRCVDGRDLEAIASGPMAALSCGP